MSSVDYYAVYEKTGRAKYISHLDLLRLFNRVFRRGSIPIAYSEGFNPHPKITFALPLPVFYESKCEILMFALREEMDIDELQQRFNSALPTGMHIVRISVGKPNVKQLDNALYKITPESLPTEDALQKFMSLNEIIVPKKTKRGILDTDVSPDIRDVSISGNDLLVRVSAGSQANLKPDCVIDAMNKYIPDYNSGSFTSLRIAICDSDNKEIK